MNILGRAFSVFGCILLFMMATVFVDTLGQLFLFIVVLLLSGLLLLAIPEALGQEVGLLIAKNRSAPQDNLGKTKGKHSFSPLPIGKLPWWSYFAAFAAVETIMVILVALGVPNVSLGKPFFPIYIYNALLERVLLEPVYVTVYSILMIIAVFFAGFVQALLFARNSGIKDPKVNDNIA